MLILCDVCWRRWVGTMDLKESDGVGSLHCMEADNSVGVKVDGGITVSNGLAWTDTHMYLRQLVPCLALAHVLLSS